MFADCPETAPSTAFQTWAKAQNDFRGRRIGYAEFLTARKIYNDHLAALDAADDGG